MRRLTILIFLLLAAPAQAAEISVAVSPADGLQFGSGDHRISGQLTESGTGLPGQVVTLEARRFPYEGEFVALQTATTGQQGRYVFHQELDRNHEVRVTAATPSPAASPTLVAFVYPRLVRLSFTQRGRNRIRLRQRYSTPEDVVLTARTYFYLGPRRGRSARLHVRARTRRISPGRFEATAVLNVPRRYRGRFRYVSCISGDPRAGMGDPAEVCGRSVRL